MPIHDWTRVDHGTFHDFHQGWGPIIRTVLNTQLLPPDYSAMVEQHADRGIPDILALEVAAPPDGNGPAAGPAAHAGLLRRRVPDAGLHPAGAGRRPAARRAAVPHARPVRQRPARIVHGGVRGDHPADPAVAHCDLSPRPDTPRNSHDR